MLRCRMHYHKNDLPASANRRKSILKHNSAQILRDQRHPTQALENLTTVSEKLAFERIPASEIPTSHAGSRNKLKRLITEPPGEHSEAATALSSSKSA